jgi:diguanylate cyclase (GGDEF)-like protein
VLSGEHSGTVGSNDTTCYNFITAIYRADLAEASYQGTSGMTVNKKRSDDDAKRLAVVLREFARTLTTEFPMQGIVDHLVAEIVDVLPVSGAGVTLISHDLSPKYVSASNDAALGFEQLQSKYADGPCILAYQSGESVAVPDLMLDSRFPVFGPAARAEGLAAVFTFPLRHGDGCIGALDLYRETAGPLSVHEMITAETMADVVSACLINAEAREQADAASARYLYDALHDPLTGLPNRTLLIDRLDEANLRAKRSRLYAAVYFVDLDRFKLVNDHHGHHVGDELLIAVARRLSNMLRADDMVARISGDEFVFLCEDLPDAVEADVIRARIEEVFERPFVVDGLRLSISASIGMAVAGPGEEISNDLIVRSDTAMYLIKRHRGGRRHVVGPIDSALNHLPQDFKQEIGEALEKGELQVAYQPIVRTSDSLMSGVEALLRWEHPTRGQIPPLLIISTAERSSLINRIGEWVLEQSCAALSAWGRPASSLGATMAVNVSARQLVSGDFFRTVQRAVDRAGLDPTRLVLEMTENLLIEDSDRALQVLGDLRRLGVRIAVDDFGTGYSSLSYLTRLPIDIVKIDQSLVPGIAGGPEAVVVSAVTNLAHELGMVVVAEGVENQEQSDEIIRIGCDYAQGFHYAEPMSQSAIKAIDWTSPLPKGPSVPR